MRIVVIGAGLAGLTAARILNDWGHDVVVVDKGGKPGGRMSTRRTEHGCFDHGAQYFTCRDERFHRQVLAWREQGLVETWDARIAVVNGDRVENEKGLAERYVAVPGMNAVCAALALELPDCRSRWEVSEIHFHDGCWELVSSEGDRLISDAVVVTVPPFQALALFQGIEFANALADIEMQPCWALMAVFDRPLLSDYDAAFVNQGPLSWLARQASRPGRSDEEAWVLHAGPEWSREHLDDEPENIQKLMLRAAFDIPIAQRCEVTFAAVHRWRYALARNPLEKGAICFEERRLAFAGDWCHGSRVEGAFLSGVTAADRILALAEV